MSAPFRPAEPAHGTDEMLRSEITDRMFPAGIYIQMVTDCAAIGDHAGIRYAIRCALVHVQQAADLAADLGAARDRRREKEAA